MTATPLSPEYTIAVLHYNTRTTILCLGNSALFLMQHYSIYGKSGALFLYGNACLQNNLIA